MMSFKCPPTATPQGDFVHDARRDPLPDARCWEALHAYLLRRGADGDVVRAGRAVWRRYWLEATGG